MPRPMRQYCAFGLMFGGRRCRMLTCMGEPRADTPPVDWGELGVSDFEREIAEAEFFKVDESSGC